MNKKVEKALRKQIKTVVENHQSFIDYKNFVNDYDAYDYPYEYYQDYFKRAAEDLQKSYDNILSFENAGRFIKEFTDKDGSKYTLTKIRGEKKYINNKEVGFVFKVQKDDRALNREIAFFVEFGIKFDFYLTQSGFEKQATEVRFDDYFLIGESEDANLLKK